MDPLLTHHRRRPFKKRAALQFHFLGDHSRYDIRWSVSLFGLVICIENCGQSSQGMCERDEKCKGPVLDRSTTGLGSGDATLQLSKPGHVQLASGLAHKSFQREFTR